MESVVNGEETRMSNAVKSSLKYRVLAECGVSRARTGVMSLAHYDVETPVFMPVGTQGSIKGLLPEQLEQLDCQIILGNTYHLGLRPGPELLKKAGGLHKFMRWNRALLTDSGGFQMVSLAQFADVTEQGVKFRSPYGGTDCMLTPEKCIEIQNAIGADIIMQLDDVVKTTFSDKSRIEESVHRTSRWFDRCAAAHARPQDQVLFPICQGTIFADLRELSTHQHLQKKDVKGYAVGGLSGGEGKRQFCKMISLSCQLLPKDKPRYIMGVGFASDLVVCCALGADMFDCVFPTRTARFGCALTIDGQINLRLAKYELDIRPIDQNCECSTCKRYSRAYLHSIVTFESVACHLLTVHNIHFQMTLMKSIRESIKEQRFPEFVRDYMEKAFPDQGKIYPQWMEEAFESVNIKLRPIAQFPKGESQLHMYVTSF